MRNIFFASAAALSMIAVPAAANAQVTADGPGATTATVADKRTVFEMNDQQQTDFDSWPKDRQVMYFGWNAPLKEYYWSLPEERRVAWWTLDANERIDLWKMNRAQRETAWSDILARPESQEFAVQTREPDYYDRNASAMAADEASAQTAYHSDQHSADREAQISYVQSAMVQPTPNDRRQVQDYPVCGADREDSCINPWAAGQRGPGVTRPLGYFPGDSSQG